MNHIPRAAKKLDVTYLLETSAGAPGTHMVAEKTDNGWSGTDDSGKRWHLFVEHLRNENLCKIKFLA